VFAAFGRRSAKIFFRYMTEQGIALHARSAGEKRDEASLVDVEIFQHVCARWR
jgi:hypothetical protein